MKRILLFLPAILIVGFFIFISAISGIYTDYLWFESHNQLAIFWKNIRFRFLFYITGFLVATLFYYFTLFTIIRRIPFQYPLAIRTLLMIGPLVAAALIHAPHLAYLRDTFFLFSGSEATGITDPLYNKDLSFYFFTLPFLESLVTYFRTLIVFQLFFAGLLLFFPAQTVDSGELNSFVDQMVRHMGGAVFPISILLALFLLTVLAGNWISAYQLVHSGTGSVVDGAGYVDVYGKRIGYFITAIVAGLAALILIISGFMRNIKVMAASFLSVPVVFLLTVQLYPSLLQAVQVNPNTFAAEKPFIEKSIAYTRQAFGLDAMNRSQFDPSGAVTTELLDRNRDIVENIRLWDYRPLQATLKQLQELRLYYEFRDVDVDRYHIDGRIRQVMLSPRELNSDLLPEQAQDWIPRHLQYTHGYGLAMVPTDRVTREGLPELWIRDFPPQTTMEGLPEIIRPGIYFGELTLDYAVVNTNIPEIDYPIEEGFAETNYSGTGGVEIGSGLRRLLIAMQFDTWRILVSRAINPDSRILYRRQIHQAVREVAPFLIFDRDPYMVVGEDGNLYWIMDAYTATDRYPYSAALNRDVMQRIRASGDLRPFLNQNYVRNSVKVVIDAYEGSMDFYVFDERDPIIKSWKSVHPEMFTAISDMPEFLTRHVRYPVTLFSLQGGILSDYHMNDPLSFYSREDRWEISSEMFDNRERFVEPYYAVIRLPGMEREETVLMLPFVPNNRRNMVAWMAARSDFVPPGQDTRPQTEELVEAVEEQFDPDESGDDLAEPVEGIGQGSLAPGVRGSNYGELILYDFPRARQVMGTMQVESRIDQDPEMSQDLALWNQQGSRVIRGNLLVIPVEDTLLYVEPIYLQSEGSPFPELRRVVAASGESLVMERDLYTALYELAGQAPHTIEDELTASERASLSPEERAERGPRIDMQNLPSEAREALRKARAAAGNGDWSEFGRRMDELEEIIRQL